MKQPLLSLFLAIAIGGGTAGAADVDVSIFAQIRLGKAPPPPPPEVIVVESHDHHGPPPWAPAHGYRAKRGYYYYPGCNVYYRPDDHMWFYLEGDNWRLGASLPTHIHIDFNRSVSLEMDSDRPYVRHRDVAAYYPADYFARVRIRHVDRPSVAVGVTISDDNRHPGRGKGAKKGNGKAKGRKK